MLPLEIPHIWICGTVEEKQYLVRKEKGLEELGVIAFPQRHNTTSPGLQWSLLKCSRTKSRLQVSLLYFPGCSIVAQKGRNENKSAVKDAFRQRGKERWNALAKGSRLLPAPFQDVPEEAGDASTELSVLILLYHLLTSLKNCSA